MPKSNRIERLSVHIAVALTWVLIPAPAQADDPAAVQAIDAAAVQAIDAAPVQAIDAAPAQANDRTQSASDDRPAFQSQRLRGKVVWLAEALKSEFGISTVPEAAEQSLAILTNEGQLIPLVENLRGRAFRKDKRLREMEVEILARRHRRQPLIQVLRLYQVEDDRLYEIDYWCDVCAIVMFETGPCSCCQDDNRLRKRLVEPQSSSAEAANPVSALRGM